MQRVLQLFRCKSGSLWSRVNNKGCDKPLRLVLPAYQIRQFTRPVTMAYQALDRGWFTDVGWVHLCTQEKRDRYSKELQACVEIPDEKYWVCDISLEFFTTDIYILASVEKRKQGMAEAKENKDGLVVSPFHDIPLYSDKENQILNMVVEVPRWSNAKMEIDTSSKMNPIKQDIKKGKLRFVNNCFPHHGYMWNYGALPQTWEDPDHTDPHTGHVGDNDPLDVCEIGFKVHKRGAVIQVKVLGTMALIDEGETDWKILAIDVTDPLADKLNDIGDLETHMPGFIKATHEWFRIYKVPTGKPENKFAFNGEAKDKKFALDVIEQTHEQWRGLINQEQKAGLPAIQSTTIEDSPSKITAEEAEKAMNDTPESGPAAEIAAEVDTWHYVKL